VELSERLARLGLRRGAASLPAPAPPRRRGPAIDELVAGEVVATEAGACFRAEASFPLSHAHGDHALASLLGQSAQAAAGLARDAQLADLDFRQAVFLDTETTGLARGTGTYVFMVGLGYFERDAFHLAQFFMRGLEEEGAMLQALAMALDRFGGVVSFNGRSFDMPLLRTRFTLARMAPAIAERPHFDLLYPARRLWRARLESCALTALEAEILGVRRDYADVPSWQIPAMYADYLRYGDAREMARVFYHNQQDVLSMVVLASHMCQLFTDPWGMPAPCAADLYSLGRLYESLSLWEEAERAYRGAAKGPSSHTVHDHALRHLSFLIKRQGRWGEACEVWWRAVVDGRQLYPYLELAKYYEWQVKDYARALEVTRQALDRLRTVPPTLRHHRARAELHHRQSRLERKLARSDADQTQESEA
jgi:uncharacterized protein YprB with RNaseH-like and TPR domain